MADKRFNQYTKTAKRLAKFESYRPRPVHPAPNNLISVLYSPGLYTPPDNAGQEISNMVALYKCIYKFYILLQSMTILYNSTIILNSILHIGKRAHFTSSIHLTDMVTHDLSGKQYALYHECCQEQDYDVIHFVLDVFS